MGEDEPRAQPAPSSPSLRTAPGSVVPDDAGSSSPTTRQSFTPTAPPPASALRRENIPPLQPPRSLAARVSDAPDDSSIALEMDGLSLLDDKHADSLTAQAVREHLQDLDSSFAPPVSPLPTIVANGMDDTFVFDSPSKKPASAVAPPQPSKSPIPSPSPSPKPTSENVPSYPSPNAPRPSPSPAPAAATPQPPKEDNGGVLPRLRNTPSEAADTTTTSATTASLEAFSSSPTAAAAARTISRAISRASAGRNDAAPDTRPDPHDNTVSTDEQSQAFYQQDVSTDEVSAPPPNSLSATLRSDGDVKRSMLDAGHTPGHALRTGQRPKFLRSRDASQRSSVSSFATNGSSHDVDSDVTVGLGTDYALQSGGAMPALGMSRGGLSSILTRSISLGSMGSALDDPDSTQHTDRLERLDEDEPDDDGGQSRSGPGFDPLATPRAPKGAKGSLSAPTDTVIARRVMNVQVPESLAREYKSKGGLTTPRKTSGFNVGSTPRHGNGRNVMTLKEQSNTIERLSKENFDLKLKVMFLNDRLDKLSEEGVKEMISENVELKTNLAVLQRDNKVLRRRVKELEKQLKEDDERDRDRDRPSTARSGGSSDSDAEQEAQEREEELVYLRERIEEYQSEVEQLKSENMAKEAEKRRMADHVKSLQSAGEKHVGLTLDRQEEADVFKDLLEQETARREQADDDNRKLRDEIFRLKQEITSSMVSGATTPGAMHHTTNIYNITKKQGGRPASPTRAGSAAAFSVGGDLDGGSNGLISVASTLVEELRREGEQLRHENAELRREVGAQTSMLTSRNREKERLYQEIEDLKLAARRGGPAPSTVDSLLERSASRAGTGRDRSGSRASGGIGIGGGPRTALSTVDDAEREEMETRLAELRDRVNEAKLHNQDLQAELNSCQEDFDAAMEAKRQAEEGALALQEELEGAMADLMALQAERDEALQENDALQAEFTALQTEAQETVDSLEAELGAKTDEAQRLQVELAERTENFAALQDEMRKLSESLVGLEDEQDNKMRKIQNLETQLAEANKELEDLEAKLLESNDKAQRLSVQQESGHAEIEFLREEQEGDKIRIGDLEASLANVERGLEDEKTRVRDLEKQLATERRQREIVADREKEEVQQFVNELNKDMSAAKDEARKLRKNLSSREKEVVEWKERLHELENNLREALGDLNGTRSSLLKSIGKLQNQLEETVRELNTAKASVMEKDHIIKQRDTLLENQSLDNRRLAELLEKERQQHRMIKSKYETFERSQQHVTHKVSSQDVRISELEQAKGAAQRRINQLEASFKEQLTERNNLLLLLWQRLSSLCGSDWAHDNSLINGRALPSMETVTTMLPGFSKNLLAAVKTIEKVVGSFHERVKDIERDLWREYRALESGLDNRARTLDRLEGIVRSGVAAGTLGTSATERELQTRVARIEDAYRQLKVENHTLRTAQDVRARAAAAAAAANSEPNTVVDPHLLAGGSPSPSIPTGPRGGSRDRSRRGNTPGASGRPPTVHSSSSFTRPKTAGELALVDGTSPGGHDDNSPVPSPVLAHQQQHTPPAPPPVAVDSRWILRLRELENKLKIEREGRLQDRSSAGQRIHELEAQTRNLARENDRRSRTGAGSTNNTVGEDGRGRQ